MNTEAFTELHKLRQWLDNGRVCGTCKGRGTILKHRPMIYETDDAREIEDAYRMASRGCPDCPDYEKASAELDLLLTARRATETPAPQPTGESPEKAENLTLRRLLWRAHSDGTQYGDDGEMQLGMIDFKRDPVDSIQAAIRDRGLRTLVLTRCTRGDHHEGPCNGYPRDTCPQ